MHSLWLGNYVGPLLAEDKSAFASFVPVKLVLLFVSGILLERMVLAFLVRRSGSMRNPLIIRRRPFSGPVLFSPSLDERLALLMPFAAIQVLGIGLLALLTYAIPPEFTRLNTVLLAGSSTLFGLMWILFLLLLPGFWSCLGYGLALCCSVGCALLAQQFPPDLLPALRILFPIFALPLIFFAAPPSNEIKERICFYRRGRTAQKHEAALSLKQRLQRLMKNRNLLATRWVKLAVLTVFGLMCAAQQLLDFAYGCPIVCAGTVLDPPMKHATSFILAGEISGAFLAAFLLAVAGGHTLLTPLVGLSLFGIASLLTTVLMESPLSGTAVFLLHVSSGCCAAFGVYFFHRFFLRHYSLFTMLSRGLFLLCLIGSFGATLLWSAATGIQSSFLTERVLYMHLLALGAFVSMLSVYLFRDTIRAFLQDIEETPVDPVPVLLEMTPATLLKSLTPREREVFEMVRAGMKNLEISSKLNISEATLRVHLRRIYRKLQIQGRSNLRGVTV